MNPTFESSKAKGFFSGFAASIFKILAVAALVFWPLGQVAAYFFRHAEYPHNDSAAYFLETQRQWVTLKTVPILKAIPSLYFERGWKPVVHPLVLLPIFSFSGGDVRLAAAAAGMFFYTVFLVYTFLLIGNFIRPIFSAVATAFVGTTPWIMQIAIEPQMELTSGAAIVAAFYHLIKSDGLTWRGHAILFAVYSGLAICLRPDVAIICLLSLVSIYILRKLNLRRIDYRNFAGVMILPVFGMLTVVISFSSMSRFLEPIRYALMALLTVVIFQFVWIKKHLKSKKWAAVTFTLAVFLVLFWYLPFVQQTYSWIHACTLDELAQRTGGGKPHGVALFSTFLEKRSASLLLPVFFSVLVLIRKCRSKTKKIRFLDSDLFFFTVPAVTAFVALLLLQSMTFNAELRYLTVPLALMLAGFFAFSFYYLRPVTQWLLTALAITVTLLQTSENLVSTNIVSLSWQGKFYASFLSKIHLQPIENHQIDNFSRISILIDGLVAQIQDRGPQTVYIIPRSSNLDEWGLTLAARESGLEWTFAPPKFSSKNLSVEEMISKIGECHCYLVLGPIEASPNHIWYPDTVGVSMAILDNNWWKTSAARGWSRVADISVRGEFSWQKTTFRLFKTGT